MELALKLTGYLAVFSLGFLAARFISRFQFNKQKAIVKRYEQAVLAKESQLVGMLYSIHHDGFNPRLKRIRGCINVCTEILKQIRVIRLKIEKLEEFAIRPNHYTYVKMIVSELKNLYKQLNEHEEFNKSISTECLEMENDILKNAEKYQS